VADDLSVWFPLYVNDILTSRMIRKFDSDQFGIFMFLLIEQWVGGPLPQDKSDLCEMARCKSWPNVEAILQAGFVMTDQGWINERLVEIWVEQDSRRKIKSRAGKAGAAARWGTKVKLLASPEAPVVTEEDGNRISPAIGREDATAMRPECDPNGNESKAKESKAEESNAKTESPESKSPPDRKRFRDDTIYIREGLAYPGQASEIVRGYNEVPIQPFLDYAASLDEKVELPDPLVIETQEALDSWLHP
jgi:uncharacterized protein YdaU (DUF1376 family)